MRDDSPWKPPSDGTDDAAQPDGFDTAAATDGAPATELAPLLTATEPPSPWAPGGSADAAQPVAPAHVPPVPTGTPTSPPSPPPPPPGLHPVDGGMPPPPGFVPGEVVADPAPPRPSRSRWLVGGAVASVVAVGGAGIFAVANLTGATEGGSSTPADLGVELLSAIENEDLLGAIDVLSPGERDSLGEPFVEVIGELTRIGVLADVDLSSIAGLDVVLDNESVQVRATNVSDIANIDLRADAAVTVDGAELPIGDLITDNLPSELATEMRGTRVTETGEIDVTLTAVLEDDRWYFSLFHTIAEAGRGAVEPGTPIPAEGIGAVGADSPEGAVDQLLDAVESLDLRLLIQMLDPAEAAALQRYAPLFLDEAEAEIAGAPFFWQITEREYRVEGGGDERTVFVDALAIEGDFDGERFSFSYRDGCTVVDVAGESIEQCVGQLGGAAAMEEMIGEAPAIRRFVEVLDAAFADMDPVGLELRERAGQWYVSPIATMTDALLAALRALDRAEVDQIAEAAPPAFEEFMELLFGGFADLGSLGGPGGELGIPLDEFDEFDEFDDPGAVPTDEFPDAYECYDVRDATEAGVCFERYVVQGALELWEVPVELRFPQCGYADLSWSGDLYTLPDDQFIAAAEQARPCFLDLLERGAVEAWELPTEITHLECFEGRNWYNVFDDTPYDDRYYDCIGRPYDGAGET